MRLRDRNKSQNMVRKVQAHPLTRNYRPYLGVEFVLWEHLFVYAKYQLLHHHLGRPLPTIFLPGTRNHPLKLDG